MIRKLNVVITLEEEDGCNYSDTAGYGYWIDNALSDINGISNVEVNVQTVNPKQIPEYLYATATVIRRDIESGNKAYWRFYVRFSDESKAEYGLQVKDGYGCGIVGSKFNKHTAPMVGDVVKLRKRISKYCNTWQGWSYPKICEVIERKI